MAALASRIGSVARAVLVVGAGLALAGCGNGSGDTTFRDLLASIGSTSGTGTDPSGSTGGTPSAPTTPSTPTAPPPTAPTPAGTSAPAPTPPLPPIVDPTATVINGIGLPPDPGALAHSTVLGIDTDANGIRDDVDRFLAAAFGAQPEQFAAAQVSARALQAVLAADARDPATAGRALAASMDAGVCVTRRLLAAGVPASALLNAVFVKTNNTPERLAQRRAVVLRAGAMSRSATGVACP